ncbi:exported hypothetical protein [Candidatus Sulfopaludibacter sp. SbA4]|nr:exported hypothetical protein [Candidatus Sulfopaludibacter sp. SbA4]
MNLRHIAAAFLCCALFATEPDEATRRWWSHVEALANDGLQGRDTGSEGYRQAARYVVTQFERAGLKPAGESGYYQSVPLHVVRLRTDQSEIELVRKDGGHKLQWLRQITMPARMGLPDTFEAGLVFAGSDENPEGLNGKIVVQLGGGRRGAAAAPRPGIAGTLTIEATGGPEPPRWPVSYSVAMTLADPWPMPRNGRRPTRRWPCASIRRSRTCCSRARATRTRSLRTWRPKASRCPGFRCPRPCAPSFESRPATSSPTTSWPRSPAPTRRWQRNTSWFRLTWTDMGSASRGTGTASTTARSTMRRMWRP